VEEKNAMCAISAELLIGRIFDVREVSMYLQLIFVQGGKAGERVERVKRK
jgi:hypothetical protein